MFKLHSPVFGCKFESNIFSWLKTNLYTLWLKLAAGLNCIKISDQWTITFLPHSIWIPKNFGRPNEHLQNDGQTCSSWCIIEISLEYGYGMPLLFKPQTMNQFITICKNENALHCSTKSKALKIQRKVMLNFLVTRIHPAQCILLKCTIHAKLFY